VTIRRATSDDVPALVALNAEVQAMHADHEPHIYRLPGPDFLTAVASWFLDLLAREDTKVLICQERETAVGYACCWIKDRPPTVYHRPLKRIHVDQFGVAASHRRRGYGRALLNAILDLARAEGASLVTLEVRAFNEGARAFYAQHGFQVTGYDMAVEVPPVGI
jgi:ribosomal protein S18 acetylase RimI-like enzyme